MMKKIVAIAALLLLVTGIYLGWGSIREVTAKVQKYLYSDPDLPPGERDVDKEAYLKARDEWVAVRRGFEPGKPFDPTARDRAIVEMGTQLEREEAARAAAIRDGRLSPSAVTDWTNVGPAPVPGGQTSGRVDPVTGRIISIAVHPTNPDIVYVGSANGGLYRTTNGSAAQPTWTPMMDTIQLQTSGFTSLGTMAIGAIAFAPSNPDIVYIGTGEQVTGYFGSGLYRIDNASQASPTLVGPINPSADYGNGVMPTFTFRSISQIIVHPTQPGTVFLATSSGGGGYTGTNGSGAPAGVPPKGLMGLYRTTNGTAAAGTVAFTKLPVNAAGGFATGNTDISDIVFDKNDATANTVVVWVRGGLGSADGCTAGNNCAGVYRSTNAMTTGTFTQSLIALNGNTRGELVSNVVSSISTILAATGESPASTGSNPNSCAADHLGLLRRSVDGGATWPTTNAASAAAGGIVRAGDGFCGGQCFYDIAVGIDPGNASIIQIGGNADYGGCQTLTKRSTDGVTLAENKTGLHGDVHVFAVAPSNPTIVWTGNDGGLWRSTDTGATWSSMNGNPATSSDPTGKISASQYFSIATHPRDREFMTGGTQDNGTHLKRSQANGGTWTQIAFGDGGYTAIDQNATDTTNVRIYHTYYNLIPTNLEYEYVTTTADAEAKNWTNRSCVAGGAGNTRLDCNDTAVLFYAPMTLGPGNPNTLYFGTDRIYRSANGGDTMQVASQASLAGAGVAVSSIGIGSDDNFRIVGMRNGKVYATTTGSATLTDVTPPAAPGVTVNKVMIDPNTTNAAAVTAYIAYGGFGTTGTPIVHMWKTTNLAGGAATWAPIGTGLPDIPVDAIAIDKKSSVVPAAANLIYIGTDIGVYRSTNGGASWAVFNPNNKLPVVPVFDIAFQEQVGTVTNNRVLRIGTHGRGIWEILIVPTASEVSIGGRVTTADGRGVRNAVVTMTDPNGVGRNVMTGPRGEFRFDNVAPGVSYVVGVRSRRFLFEPQVVTVNDNVTDLTFIAGGGSITEKSLAMQKPARE